MRKTQVLLTEGQLRRLRGVAAERGVSVAQVIRDALDQVLDGSGAGLSRREARRRAAAVAGRFRSGFHDVAARHDEHLAEAYATRGASAGEG